MSTSLLSIPFMKKDDTYPTAKIALNKDSDADIMRVDIRIYFRNDEWHIITLVIRKIMIKAK